MQRLAIGDPLAAGLPETFNTHSYQSVRTTFILGDPTLRTHYAKSATNVWASRTSSTITVNWTNPSTGSDGTYVYWATNKLSGAWTTLSGSPFPNTISSANHTTTITNTLYYMVRTYKTTTTHSDSYTNLAQGILAAVP